MCSPLFVFLNTHNVPLPSPPPLAPVRLHASLEGMRAGGRGVGGAGGGHGAPPTFSGIKIQDETWTTTCALLNLRIGFEYFYFFGALRKRDQMAGSAGKMPL